MMRLLIDLRGCHHNQDRGIPGYAQSLALAVARAPGVSCSFLIYKSQPPLATEATLRCYGAVHYFEDIDRLGIPPCDAFLITSLMHGLDHAGHIERLAIPPAVAAHQPMISAILYDLIPLIFKDVYLQQPGTKRGYMNALQMLKRCDHLFAISDASATDATRLVGIPPSKISTISGGINLDVWKESFVNERAGHRKSELVYVGGEDFRKNMDVLIKSFVQFKNECPTSDLKLVIICALSKIGRLHLTQLLTEMGQEAVGDVELTGLISNEELVDRVSSAKALIFPSLYEGLGLPILEAYAVGTPVFGSNNSSIIELVHPDCLFDPYSTRSIISAIFAIEQNTPLLQASVEFGRHVLTKFDWGKVAQVVVATLGGYVGNRVARGRNRIDEQTVAIFGPLAPEQSGVAVYNSKAFASSKRPIVFFTDMVDEDTVAQKTLELAPAKKTDGIELVPISEYTRFQPTGRHFATVFVIGNSEHSLSALIAAVDHRNIRIPRVLYLHEARVVGLLYTYYDRNIYALMSRLSEYYPELRDAEYRHTPYKILNGHIMGVRLLLALTGDCTIFVNSERARLLVDAELSGFAACNYEVLFHPVFDAQESVAKRIGDSGELVIGHFGIVGSMKRPDVLIDAAKIISHKRRVKLIFAGFDVSQALAGTFPPEFVECISNPSDQRLTELMRGVDVAVQPREPDHGESSGVVNQLIALGKRPVVSAGTSADDLGELVRSIRRGADAAAWAEAILEVEASANLKNYHGHLSVEAFGRVFDRAIDGLKRD